MDPSSRKFENYEGQKYCQPSCDYVQAVQPYIDITLWIPFTLRRFNFFQKGKIFCSCNYIILNNFFEEQIFFFFMNRWKVIHEKSTDFQHFFFFTFLIIILCYFLKNHKSGKKIDKLKTIHGWIYQNNERTTKKLKNLLEIKEHTGSQCEYDKFELQMRKYLVRTTPVQWS